MESPKEQEEEEECRNSDNDNNQESVEQSEQQDSAGGTEEQSEEQSSSADEDVEEQSEQPWPAFRWWCEAGMVANMDKIAREFCLWRCLRPVRICVVGRPGSCAGELAAGLASRFQVPLFACEALVEEHVSTGTALGKQLREKMDEIQSALGNPKSGGPFFLPASLTSQMFEASLALRSTVYRGYIFSGFPATAEEFTLTFMEDGPPPEPGSEDQEEPPAAAPPPAPAKGAKVAVAAEPPPVPKVPRLSVAPELVVAVSASDEACQQRLQAAARPVGQRELQLKSDRWKKENPEDGTSLHDLFQEGFGCEVVHCEEVTQPEEVAREVERIAKALETACQVVNFLPCAPIADGTGDSEQATNKANDGNLEESARAEAALAKKKEEGKIEQIRREEIALLERHSDPLRRYMTSFVAPTLTTGLVEICRRQPDDPVGYLAEYLSIYGELVRRRRRQKAATAAAAAAAAAQVGYSSERSSPT